MSDVECTAFLQWALPRLGMRWPGFRKVRGQVCKRVKRRIGDLNLDGFAAYRERLEVDPQEWDVLDQCCHVTISRFYRDKSLFDGLRATVFPHVVARARRESRHARFWSSGCASGEEPYTLKLLWDLETRITYPDIRLSIIATDIDEAMLDRARRGCYRPTSLRQLPRDLIARGFGPAGPLFCVQPRYREGVVFLRQDLRSETPRDRFDMILCRNIAFTYFAPCLQQAVLARLATKLLSNGYLVLGAHERLPEDVRRFAPVESLPNVFQRIA
jgi:chemotaxis protein methyltransferase CheR